MNALKGLIFSAILIISLVFPQKIRAKIKVSGPEYAWSITHPFIAFKAKRISKYVLFITDSLEAAGVLKDRSGGQLDAFKHAFWMASLAQDLKVIKAYKLGVAHEKYNYKQSKKGRGGGDRAASEMDLWNNNVGLNLGHVYQNMSNDALIELIISFIKRGEMRIVKKDAYGNSLDCQGQLIDKLSLKTWVNKRCLVASDFNNNL